MPVMRALGHAVATTARGLRAGTRRVFGGTRWTTRAVGRARARGAGGETGMIRLFDLHAANAAGDTLITIGLASTIFFSVPLGEARGNVALYLLVTMVPFAVLAPLIGPLLDHLRHGRRYALAASMLGRAILAWLIADYLDSIALYPAAFGILVLSRTYGVARAAAVPRLLPERLGLSLANARGSLYGTLAGAAVVPIGLAAFRFGPQWPLRVAAAIFLVGMVIALRLPARADSDPPQAVPRLFRFTWLRRGRNGDRVLTGRLVIAALLGSSVHRALYGFLLLFLAFALRAGDLDPTTFLGVTLGEGAALGLVAGALVFGTFLAVAIGSRLRIRHPTAVQAGGLVVVTALAVLATVQFSLAAIVLLCLATAISSGLAKLAIDSSIQERIEERLRASAFAHSETLLMLAWVAGGALGLIPVPGRVGVGVAAGLVALAAARALVVAVRLRRDTLHGRPASGTTFLTSTTGERTTDQRGAGERGAGERGADQRGADQRGTRQQPVVAVRAERPPPRRTRPDPPTETAPAPDADLAPPGYHIYRPSGQRAAAADPAERAGPADPRGADHRGSE